MEPGSKITMVVPEQGNRKLCILLKKIGKYYEDYQRGYSETAYNAWRESIDAAAAIIGMDDEYTRYDVCWRTECGNGEIVLSITPIQQRWVDWRGVKE